MLDDISLTLKTSDFFIKSTQIDIAFLNIGLQVCNGIDYGQYLRELYPHIIIIYITAREDLVFNIFSTGIFQFIRKSKYKQDSILVFEQLIYIYSLDEVELYEIITHKEYERLGRSRV